VWYYFWQAYSGKLIADVAVSIKVPDKKTIQIPITIPVRCIVCRCYFVNPTGWYRGSVTMLDSKGDVVSSKKLESKNQYSFMGSESINRSIIVSPGMLVIKIRKTELIENKIDLLVELDWNVTDLNLQKMLKPKIPENIRFCIRGS
jgi:hypothetical protein